VAEIGNTGRKGKKWIVYTWYTVQYTRKLVKIRPVYKNIQQIYTKTEIGLNPKVAANLGPREAQIQFLLYLTYLIV